MLRIFIIYMVVALVFMICEYHNVKSNCGYNQKPNLERCIYRGLFFPLTVIKKIVEYIIKD